MFGNIQGNKCNIYERDWSKFDQENFILDYSIDWEDLLKIDELKADNLTKIYIDKINMLLDTGIELTVREMRFVIHFENFTEHFSLIFVKFANQSLIVKLRFIFKQR